LTAPEASLINGIAYAIYREGAYLVDMGVADAETVNRAFRNAVGLWAVTRFAGLI
jgi:3-hydroxybutyryl-CoA dehydrogenase